MMTDCRSCPKQDELAHFALQHVADGHKYGGHNRKAERVAAAHKTAKNFASLGEYTRIF